MPSLINYKEGTQIYNIAFGTDNSPGFTLIEILVSITILAIIASIGLTTYNRAQITGRDARRKDDLRSVQTALGLYYESQSPHSYPNTNSWSTLGTTYLVPSTGSTFINQMPSDPFSTDPYNYVYNGTGTCSLTTCTGFELCASLENTSAPTDNLTTNTRGICPPGSGPTRFYHITGP